MHNGRTAWTGPSWLGPGYAFIGSWEPLVFRRRRGGLRTDEAQRYARERSADAIADMLSVGAELVVLPWDKGFGPTAQRADQDASREWARALHDAGMRVGAYIRYDNVVPETMAADLPQLDSWVARTGQDQPAAILHQSYRLAVQPTHEEHLAHIDRLIVGAIDELDADLIHLDGFWMQNLAWADTSPATVDAFRHFLRETYPDAQSATERFGHDRLAGIVPPVFREQDMTLDAFARVTDPVVQEWLIFRATLTERLAERFAGVVHDAALRVGREVAFTANSLIPIGYSNGLYWGFDVDRNGQHLDGQWTEDDHWAELRADGVLVSRIREFKIGAAVGTRVFSYQRASSERQLQVSIAQALAFNDGVVGMLGSPLVRDEPYFEAKRTAMEWVRRNLVALTGGESAAEVAVLRSPRTLMFEAAEAHRSVILAELMLVQGRIPFDIVFDEVFAHLDRYRVLVLPDAACLSDAQVEAVRRFVMAGGGVVASGRTSNYDEWYRQRPRPGLADLFGPDVEHHEGDAWQRPRNSLRGSGDTARHECGLGRVAYLPEIVTDREPQYRGTLGEQPYRFGTEEWQVPANMSAFLDAIAWVSRTTSRLIVDAPAGVAVDLQRAPSGAIVVHLVDYDLDRSESMGVDIIVRGINPDSVTVHEFGHEPRPIYFVAEKSTVTLNLKFAVYAGVVIA